MRIFLSISFNPYPQSLTFRINDIISNNKNRTNDHYSYNQMAKTSHT